MAKKPVTSSRKQKLKVFRTPIGFHDAYVAAPSQKAALEAWGADGNLFAQGIAEQVNDPNLMEEPLERPGEVIRKPRGSADEHIAALDRTARPKKAGNAKESKSGNVVPLKPKKSKPKPKPKPKPSRAALDAAEEALEKAEKTQRKKLAEIEKALEKLERKRGELQRRHEAEHDKLVERRDGARADYRNALREWDG